MKQGPAHATQLAKSFSWDRETVFLQMFRKLSLRREALTKLQATIIVAVIICATIISVSAWWVTKPKVAPTTPSPPPTPTPSPTPTTTPTPTPLPTPIERALKSVIKVEAEGAVLHYQNENFWDENQFSRILEYKAEFRSELIEQFNESLSTCGERGEYAVNAGVEFDEARKSTIMACDILGATTKRDSGYHATFRWLLRPLGLDFIDNNFEHPENGLYWEGSISGVPTTVTLRFPVSVPAWGQPNGHCHAHVWWEI